jgi:hypothetical protein
MVSLTFAWAALAKSLAWENWKLVLAGYGLPRWVESTVRPLVPVFELIVAISLVVAPLRPAGALALVAVAGFSFALLYARAKVGDVLPCGCFGKRKETSYRVPLLRNILLAALTAIVLIGPRSTTLARELAGIDRTLPVLLVAAGSLSIIWILSSAFSSMRGQR